MRPIATPSAYYLFATTTGLAFVGLILSSTLLVVMAMACLFLLSSAFALTLPLSRQLRREGFALTWKLLPQPAPMINADINLEFCLRYRGKEKLRVMRATPITNQRIKNKYSHCFYALSGSQEKLSFRVKCDQLGIAVCYGIAMNIQGALGYFRVPLYFPHMLRFYVESTFWQPSSKRHSTAYMRNANNHLKKQRQQKNDGDIHTLRKYQPGDPYRHISWRATARHRDLIVAERNAVEEESHWFICDIGIAFNDAKHSQKVLHLVQWLLWHVKQCHAEGSPWGINVFDTDTLRQLPKGLGGAHFQNSVALSRMIPDIISNERVSLNMNMMVEWLGKLLEFQHGIMFKDKDGRWDAPALIHYVRHNLSHQSQSGSVCNHSDWELLLDACRFYGLALPALNSVSSSRRAQSFLRSLEMLVDAKEKHSTIHIAIDPSSLENNTSIASALHRIKKQGNKIEMTVFSDSHREIIAAEWHIPPTSINVINKRG